MSVGFALARLREDERERGRRADRAHAPTASSQGARTTSLRGEERERERDFLFFCFSVLRNRKTEKQKNRKSREEVGVEREVRRGESRGVAKTDFVFSTSDGRGGLRWVLVKPCPRSDAFSRAIDTSARRMRRRVSAVAPLPVASRVVDSLTARLRVRVFDRPLSPFTDKILLLPQFHSLI